MLALVGGERRFGVRVGEAGSGKSFVLRDFAKTAENIYLCSIPPADVLSPSGLMQVIAQALGVQRGFTYRYDAFNNLAAHFREGAPLMVSGESAARVIDVLCTAERSSLQGGIALPLAERGAPRHGKSR